MVDWLASKIIEQYEERFADDEGYVEEKKEELSQLDRLKAFRHVIQLDDEGIKVLANKLGCKASELRAAASFVCQYI